VRVRERMMPGGRRFGPSWLEHAEEELQLGSSGSDGTSLEGMDRNLMEWCNLNGYGIFLFLFFVTALNGVHVVI
jgi:hypothetical protein